MWRAKTNSLQDSYHANGPGSLTSGNGKQSIAFRKAVVEKITCVNTIIKGNIVSGFVKRFRLPLSGINSATPVNEISDVLHGLRCDHTDFHMDIQFFGFLSFIVGV